MPASMQPDIPHWFVFLVRVEDALARRLSARPQHLERLALLRDEVAYAAVLCRDRSEDPCPA